MGDDFGLSVRRPSSVPSTGRDERTRTVAFLTGGDRFEDWFDKVGISFATFRDELTGGWLFNYIDAMRLASIRTVLLFASARVRAPMRFVHAPTRTPVCILPTPWAERKLGAAQARFWPDRQTVSTIRSYLSAPLRDLSRQLRRERCEAILCQEYEHPRFDVCVGLGRMLGLPTFATYQGANQTSSAFERLIRRMSIRRGAGFIVGAGSEIARIRETYDIDPARIAHIPNPMDVAGWRPLDRDDVRVQLGIHLGARVVAWHGHAQVRRKGLDVLLDAWEIVCSRRADPDVLLLLVGTGRNTADLRRRVSGNRRVRWIDRYVLDRTELWRYLSAADVYCLASRHEGFAVAPIEAMTCGLPVVATDVSGVRDLLGWGEAGGGVIVPREDPAAIATALLRLLDDEGWARELGRRARLRAEQEFSLEVVGRKLSRFLFPGSGTIEN
jgi:glycosyltransferase involved in cell wall biosynthesis